MSSNIEGISAETVEAVAQAIAKTMGAENETDETFWKCRTYEAKAAITALLSSGEVVLKNDVEELVEALRFIQTELGFSLSMDGDPYQKKSYKAATEALTKFTDQSFLRKDGSSCVNEVNDNTTPKREE